MDRNGYDEWGNWGSTLHVAEVMSHSLERAITKSNGEIDWVTHGSGGNSTSNLAAGKYRFHYSAQRPHYYNCGIRPGRGETDNWTPPYECQSVMVVHSQCSAILTVTNGPNMTVSGNPRANYPAGVAISFPAQVRNTASAISYMATHQEARNVRYRIDLDIGRTGTVNQQFQETVGDFAAGENRTYSRTWTNPTVGNHAIRHCINPAGGTSVNSGSHCSGWKNFTVTNNVASLPPSLSFTADPMVVRPGQTTLLSWVPGNVTNCVASATPPNANWSGAISAMRATHVKASAPLSADTTFRLACRDVSGATITRTRKVIVEPGALNLPTIHLDIDRSRITLGHEANLAWTAFNANRCTATTQPNTVPEWRGSVNLGGNPGGAVVPVFPNAAGSYRFNLSCSNAAGSVSRSVTLAVISDVTPPPTHPEFETPPEEPPADEALPPQIVRFEPEHSDVIYGGDNKLEFVVLNTPASGCRLSGTGISGSVSVTFNATSRVGTYTPPTGIFTTPGTKNYTLTCQRLPEYAGTDHPAVAHTSFTVTRPPAPVIEEFTINNESPTASVNYGTNPRFRWRTQNVTGNNCRITGSSITPFVPVNSLGAINTSGRPVGLFNASNGVTSFPYNREYTITCTGLPGSSPNTDKKTVTLSVVPPAPQITLVSDPTASNPIFVDTDVTLHWSMQNTRNCVFTGPGGPISPFGGVGGSAVGAAPPASGSYGLTSIKRDQAGTYRISCDGFPGAPTGVRVATVNLDVLHEAKITVDPTVIRWGEETRVEWEHDESSACTFTGTGLTNTVGTPGGDGLRSGSQIISGITGERTFTIDCGPGGSDSATVRVLPTVQET